MWTLHLALIGWAFWGPGLSWAHTQGVRARTQALPPPHRQASAPGATRPPRRPAFRAAQGLEPGGQHAPAAVTGAQGWQQRRAHDPATRAAGSPASEHTRPPAAAAAHQQGGTALSPARPQKLPGANQSRHLKTSRRIQMGPGEPLRSESTCQERHACGLCHKIITGRRGVT